MIYNNYNIVQNIYERRATGEGGGESSDFSIFADVKVAIAIVYESVDTPVQSFEQDSGNESRI